jgi:hypothetical protein
MVSVVVLLKSGKCVGTADNGAQLRVRWSGTSLFIVKDWK